MEVRQRSIRQRTLSLSNNKYNIALRAVAYVVVGTIVFGLGLIWVSLNVPQSI